MSLDLCFAMLENGSETTITIQCYSLDISQCSISILRHTTFIVVIIIIITTNKNYTYSIYQLQVGPRLLYCATINIKAHKVVQNYRLPMHLVVLLCSQGILLCKSKHSTSIVLDLGSGIIYYNRQKRHIGSPCI